MTPEVPDNPTPTGLATSKEGQRYLDASWNSLTQNMRKFLVVRAQCGSDAEACKVLGLAVTRAAQWKSNTPAFLAAHVLVTSSPVLFAQAQVKALAPKAVNVLDEAMDAMLPAVTGRTEDGRVCIEMVPAIKERLRASELAMKASGMLNTTVNINQRKMTYEERLYRMRLEQGIEVPENVRAKFEEVGEE